MLLQPHHTRAWAPRVPQDGCLSPASCVPLEALPALSRPWALLVWRSPSVTTHWTELSQGDPVPCQGWQRCDFCWMTGWMN